MGGFEGGACATWKCPDSEPDKECNGESRRCYSYVAASRLSVSWSCSGRARLEWSAERLQSVAALQEEIFTPATDELARRLVR